ncbi:LOW QUALITY PROTEIN: BAG family molecular chaperone regulator 7 [Herrania umbratica]|uniref:LOW QUALITY PROTEIN: BAG family molecular chaperone regulator 7 n=1 Tax=Herrania umbratica TaxID=108875 RepID=A0A6J1AJQ9_9ROSI|nr:LOW QUALITY PROTEIN: BAG family molecular chaperone regulator 7 [Herrania umbratica]
MNRFRRIDILEPYSSPLFVKETSIFAPKPLAFPAFFEEDDDLTFALDVLNPFPCFSPIEIYDSVTDLVQIEKTPSFCSYKRIQRRVEPGFSIKNLCDRVTALESKFDRLVNARKSGGERKYTWTTEIKGPVEKKYKWIAEIKDGKKKEAEKEKKYKWTAEIEGKGIDGPISRKYTFTASTGDAGEFSKLEKKEKNEEGHKKDKKGENDTRIVEIEEPSDDGAVVLRQAFARRAGVIRNKRGKKKELSPQDAALMIQVTFRAYLIRRSQALRALRDLAVAKTKLKEIRAYFNNFSYRRRVAQDAEERQRFSEKIIVLLLTVDGIEGADLMVRAAKKSMVDELEAMLDVVDPQPPGKSLSMRRTFDMPDSVIQKEIAEGVAQVVRMFESEENAAAV